MPPAHTNQDTGPDDPVPPIPAGPAEARQLPTLYGCAIGRALATVRVRSGMSAWTLAVLLDRSPADVLDMEDGRAAVSVAVLELWCDQLGVRAGSVLAWAARVVRPDVRGWVVDLRAVAEVPTSRDQPYVRKLAAWARQLRGDDAHGPFLAVPEPEIRALAARWSIPLGQLIELLADLTPLALVPWGESEQDRSATGAVQAWHARPRRPLPPANVSARGSDVAFPDTTVTTRCPLSARLGLLLRRERLARDRDLRSLAQALDVSSSHICRVELARTEAKLSFLARWCTELGVQLSELLRMAEDNASWAPAVLAPPVKVAASTPADLVLPTWAMPLYRSSTAGPRPARTGTRCGHPELQTRVERRAGRPTDITRCVRCGQPVSIRTTSIPVRAVSCPIPPDVVILDEGVIAV